jgi:hypothetical protein
MHAQAWRVLLLLFSTTMHAWTSMVNVNLWSCLSLLRSSSCRFTFRGKKAEFLSLRVCLKYDPVNPDSVKLTLTTVRTVHGAGGLHCARSVAATALEPPPTAALIPVLAKHWTRNRYDHPIFYSVWCRNIWDGVIYKPRVG